MCFPGKISERPGDDHSLDGGIPMCGRIVLDLDVAQALPVKHDGSISHRLGGLDSGIDIEANIVKIVSIDVIPARLAGVDRQYGVTFQREVVADCPPSRRPETVSA